MDEGVRRLSRRSRSGGVLRAGAPGDRRRPNAISRAHADRAAEILLAGLRRNPDHPGAMHYLVHANDVPGRERESLEITRKYDAVAPRNPHALHMPTHIYTRLGDWDGVIRGNLRAADAALEHPAGENGEYVWDEFPHAIEYLVYAYLQKGADTARRGAAEAAARHGATGTHLQDRVPPGVDAGALRAGAARLERGGGTRAARSRPRSSGTGSPGPKPSRGSRTGWARRTWASSTRPATASARLEAARGRHAQGAARSCSRATSTCCASS